jgi:DNA-binding beta-propeller fold protein YncE
MKLSAALFVLSLVAFLVVAAPAMAKPTHIFKESFGIPPGDTALALAANSGIAVDRTTHDVYVADTGNHRVDAFSQAGTFLRTFGSGVGGAGFNVCTTGCAAGTATAAPGGFETPTFVAIDNSGGASAGDIYVADTTANLISKFEADGTLISNWATGGQLGPFNAIDGITVNSDGDLDVLQGSFEPMRVYKEDGSLKEEFEPPLFSAPQGLAVDAAGNFFKANASLQVEKFSATGAEIGLISREEGSTTGLTVDPSDGDLFVDTTSGSIESFTFEASGEIAGTGCTPEPGVGCPPSDLFGGGHLTSGAGLAVDGSSGKVYAADAGAATIVVFGPATLPDTITEAASGVTAHAVAFHGTISAAGGPATNGCEFQYTSKAKFEEQGFEGASSVMCVPPGPFTGSSSEAVEAEVTGLAAGTAFVFRLVGSNEVGTNPAGALEFETQGPRVVSESASDVTATSANLEAEITPRGLATSYHFEYDTSPYADGGPAHGISTSSGSAGSGETGVATSISLQDLQSLTTYHYRVVAENSSGTAFGTDHSFRTQGAPPALLPDDRAWELVTPANKHGAPLEPITEEGGLIEAAAGGTAFASIAKGPLGPLSMGSRSPEDSQFLSNRGPSGWTTQDVTTPHEEVSLIRPGKNSEYKFFSANLSAGIVEPKGNTLLDAGNPLNTERTPYRREGDGSFFPLVNAGNAPANTPFGGEELEQGTGEWGHGVKFVTATSDLSHVLLSSPAILAGDFTPGFIPVEESIFELSGGTLRLVSVLPSGEPTAEAGVAVGVGDESVGMRGAVSADGQRVFFNAGGELLMRANADAPQSVSGSCDEPGRACTLRIDAAESGCGTCASGGGRFQAANIEGTRVFFTDSARLTADSTAAPQKPDLYMCQIEEQAGHLRCALSDLTVDGHIGQAATVIGSLLALDEEGNHAYFVADGNLTSGEGAVQGDCGAGGFLPAQTCNLYEYDVSTDRLQLVAVVSGGDRGTMETGGPGFPGITARVSPDGRYFAFMSQRSLTGYDNRDVASGEPDAEVYLYNSASGLLRCVSCNPSGARPQGVFDPPRESDPLLVDHHRDWRERWLAASIPGWTSLEIGHALYQSRYLSNSGRLFFNSSDALVPADTNGVMDVYEYEPPGGAGQPASNDCTTSSTSYGAASGGCVSLISSGTSPEESAFLDASESGDDVFFLTQSRLTPKDIDSAFDVYDASAGGGEPQLVNPPTCDGDACQLPATPPIDATPGSLTFNGAGNLVDCPKGKVKQKGKCVKKKTKKHKHKARKKSSSKKKGSGKSNKQRRATGHDGGGHK